MTKSKNPAGETQDIASSLFAISAVGPRAEAFWKVQEAAVEHVRSFLDAWCERRRDAAASAADCCAQVMNGGDASAASQALTDWMSAETERLREDVQAQAALATRIASDLAGGLVLNGGAKQNRRKTRTEAGADGDGGLRARPAADLR